MPLSLSLSYIVSLKSPDKRSQLWRMSGSGLLVHVASSSQGENLVLDVNEPIRRRKFAEGGHAPLVINQASSHRMSTQTWEFTEVSLCV